MIRYGASMVALATLLTGCDRTAPDAPAAQDTSPPPVLAPTPGESATASIFAPEADMPQAPPEPEKPLELNVSFAQGDSELDDAALARLRELVSDQRFPRSGAIILGGHTDAGGDDAANLRISRQRAEAVREWLAEAGVDPARIAVVAFGEQNPRRPNAAPDGSPDTAGRAANRRVEVTFQASQPPRSSPPGPM